MVGLDPDALKSVLDTLNKYARRKLTPAYVLELDHNDEFPAQVMKDLNDPAKLGLHLLFIPEEYGGLGCSSYDVYRVSEILAVIDLGIATSVLATFLGSEPIKVGGTPEQKTHWMGRIAEEGLLVAYGATEPQAGSDLAALTTSATPVVEDGQLRGYRLNGRKQWISNGGVATVYTILANAPGGPSWFILERDTPGFTQGKPEDKHGIRSSNTAALYLDDAFVTADRLVGGVEGQGLEQAQAVFGYTRLMVGAFGLGAGWGALQRAIRYAQQRTQGGAPLSQKQGYMHKLIVPNAVRLEASRAYIEWVAERLDCGEEGLQTEGAVAKYLATEAGNRAAEDSIQALGGYGYTREYMVEKAKRDVRITTIYEGTSEILEWTIARNRWQSHLKTRGAFYEEWAERMALMAAGDDSTGAGTASLALRALAAIFEQCRVDRLTRNQHILFRLGELAAAAEAAAVFAERALRSPSQAVPMDASTEGVMARVFARQTALKVTMEGLQWAVGAGADGGGLTSSLRLPDIYAAQAGLITDMDNVAAKLVEAYPA